MNNEIQLHKLMLQAGYASPKNAARATLLASLLMEDLRQMLELHGSGFDWVTPKFRARLMKKLQENNSDL